jgi:hypothetical protein
MQADTAPAPDIPFAWLLTLRCAHLAGLPDGPVQPLVHCASCGQDSPVVLAVRQR